MDPDPDPDPAPDLSIFVTKMTEHFFLKNFFFSFLVT